MKCFYHPGVDAVGTCSQCGKAACRDCINEVQGAMLCKSCYALAVQDRNMQIQDAVIQKKNQATIALIHLGAATLFGLVGITIYLNLYFQGAIDKNVQMPVVLQALLSMYCPYCMYMGLLRVCKLWKVMTVSGGALVFLGGLSLVVLCLCFYIPLVFAWMYGCLGGGILETVLLINTARSSKVAGER